MSEPLQTSRTAFAMRAAVVAEARTWLGTPWQHAGRVKGAGVDCAMLLGEVYTRAGAIDWDWNTVYPPDWHCHRSEERFVETVERFATEYDWQAKGLKAADVVLWRYGRTFSHAGIVSDWPRVIHAFAPSMIVEEVSVTGSPMDGRAMRAFALWPDRAEA